MLLAASIAFNPGWVRIDALRDAALSWHIPSPAAVMRGTRMYIDAPPRHRIGLASAIVRNVLRTNTRLSTVDALVLTAATLRAAELAHIDAAFLAATLLQESAYDPYAMSGAGAAGIGQFMVGTADLAGINPFDAPAAIEATARLLAAYLAEYRARGWGDPYALTLAAYNAGPGTVAHYGGVPPYAETREYIIDITERWSRIVRDR